MQSSSVKAKCISCGEMQESELCEECAAVMAETFGEDLVALPSSIRETHGKPSGTPALP